MNAETIVEIRVGTVLISDRRSLNYMALGIQCIEVTEQRFMFRRMNLFYNGETFFLTRQALGGSLWEIAPMGEQLRFL